MRVSFFSCQTALYRCQDVVTSGRILPKEALALLALVWLCTFLPVALCLPEIPCEAIDIRNDPINNREKFKQLFEEQLVNCTVIEGSVFFVLMTNANLTHKDFEHFHLPNVREITGFVLVFQVEGLRTLNHVFPNLRVIRGDSLIHNYALVLYQTGLHQIGLNTLAVIKNGGVRISDNKYLCNADSLNWNSMMLTETPLAIVDMNQDPNTCTNTCPELFSGFCEVNDDRLGHSQEITPSCWDSESCQIQYRCALECGGGFCNISQSGQRICCHEECLGGCVGNSSYDCYACKHVIFNGECRNECPEGYYKYHERRCVSAEECRAMPSKQDEFAHPRYFKALRGHDGSSAGVCSLDCPEGYEEPENDKASCAKCAGPCKKRCHGQTILSEAEAQKLQGCHIINGALEFRVRTGPQQKHLLQRIEQYLSKIEEVTQYIRISFSPSFLTLNVLKNLKVIRGEQLWYNKYALTVFENEHLTNLWPVEGHRLEIYRGGVQFQNNPKLCPSIIHKFVDNTVILNSTAEKDISHFSNGNEVVCEEITIPFDAAVVMSTEIVARWEEFNTTDMDDRSFLGYKLFYKEVENENVSINDQRDACADTWQFTFVPPTERGGIIIDLKPHTLYAIYLVTLMINSPGAKGGISKLVFVRTRFDQPSPAIIKQVGTSSPHDIVIAWDPPEKPNGVITHYVVQYTPRFDYLPPGRDYCKHPPVNDHPDKALGIPGEDVQPQPFSVATSPFGKSSDVCSASGCCDCKKSNRSALPSEAPGKADIAARQEKNDFENLLHNVVFIAKNGTGNSSSASAVLQAPFEDLSDGRIKRSKLNWTTVLSSVDDARLASRSIRSVSLRSHETDAETVTISGSYVKIASFPLADCNDNDIDDAKPRLCASVQEEPAEHHLLQYYHQQLQPRPPQPALASEERRELGQSAERNESNGRLLSHFLLKPKFKRHKRAVSSAPANLTSKGSEKHSSSRLRTVDAFGSSLLDSEHRKNASWPSNVSLKENEIPIGGSARLLVPKTISFNVTGTKVTISNLSHYTLYEVRVRACQNTSEEQYYCSETEATALKRTRRIADKDAINQSSVHVLNDTTKSPDSRSIRFLFPRDPNGLIVSADIEYGLVSSVGHTNYRPQCIPVANFTDKGNVGFYELTNLSPGNYSLRIRIFSLAGPGPFTEPIFFVVPGPWTLSTIVIIGIVVSIFVIVFAVFLVISRIVVRRKMRERENQFIQNVMTNPDYITQTDFYKADDWELLREDILLEKEIGEGTFGKVLFGVGKNVKSKCGVTFGPCAVKTIRGNAGIVEVCHFLREASFMKLFQTAHIIKLYGVVSNGQPALVVMEYMHKGNLKDYLRSRRPDAEENIDNLPPPTLNEICKWAGQIADGMAYLEHIKFCHRDLAARNCLICEDNKCKIGDFGMARDVYVKEYYRPDGRRLMPVRWMAPEALRDAKFSPKSDVWSYGIVLWEMVTLAAQPYQGLDNEAVMDFVYNGHVMDQPKDCPEILYASMLLCWKFNPRDRPSFIDIVELFLPKMDESFKQDSFFCNEGQTVKRRSSNDGPSALIATVGDIRTLSGTKVLVGHSQNSPNRANAQSSSREGRSHRSQPPPLAHRSSSQTQQDSEKSDSVLIGSGSGGSSATRDRHNSTLTAQFSDSPVALLLPPSAADPLDSVDCDDTPLSPSDDIEMGPLCSNNRRLAMVKSVSTPAYQRGANGGGTSSGGGIVRVLRSPGSTDPNDRRGGNHLGNGSLLNGHVAFAT